MGQETTHILGSFGPLSAHGHINVSPKGTADCFHVVNSKQVWYEDLSGSGIETISHLRENGRITVMFCALDGPPRIVRLFGVGTVHEYGTPEYDALIPAATRKPGSRAAIVIDIYQVGSVQRSIHAGTKPQSCGFAVPLYDFVTHRTQLLRGFYKKEAIDKSFASSCEDSEADGERVKTARDTETVPPGSLRAYWLLKNARSLDGLQSNFDKEGPRPPLRRGTESGDDKSGGQVFVDGKSLALGFAFGVVAASAVTRALGKLQG
ncbi:hypothetical protein BU15DRAFT_89454 [Melanogaster broomeanus]|nr:hypothetical protein BU15DRAFT_89454 [Melanogaster broomeanus]